MDNDRVAKIVREILARELAPLTLNCVQMQERIARLENTLPQIANPHERIAARVELVVARAKLGAMISGMQDDVETVVCRIKSRKAL
jgi:hypothetical protein